MVASFTLLPKFERNAPVT